MNFRENVLSKIKPSNRVIEFGPLNRPIIKKNGFKNVFYADIKNKQEIIDLYTDNAYLKSTGIAIDVNTIVDIDYVIEKDYKNTFKGKDKFDFAILSHVIEHMPDILFFFKDIENVLKENGKLIIIYPDSRYCFDHYRNEVSFRDAYATYNEGVIENARLAFDFTLNVVKENDPFFFWNNQNISDKINTGDPSLAIAAYRDTKNKKFLDDVHYWPFTDYSFVKFLYEGKKMGLINFDLIEFFKTEPNTQEFMVILEYNSSQKKENMEYIKKILDELDPIIKEKKLNDEIVSKERKILELQYQIDQMLNSNSWRITKPLRVISNKLRK